MRYVTLLSLFAVAGCASTQSQNPPPQHIAPYATQKTAQINEPYQQSIQDNRSKDLEHPYGK